MTFPNNLLINCFANFYFSLALNRVVGPVLAIRWSINIFLSSCRKNHKKLQLFAKDIGNFVFKFSQESDLGFVFLEFDFKLNKEIPKLQLAQNCESKALYSSSLKNPKVDRQDI